MRVQAEASTLCQGLRHVPGTAVGAVAELATEVVPVGSAALATVDGLLVGDEGCRARVLRVVDVFAAAAPPDVRQPYGFKRQAAVDQLRVPHVPASEQSARAVHAAVSGRQAQDMQWAAGCCVSLGGPHSSTAPYPKA